MANHFVKSFSSDGSGSNRRNTTSYPTGQPLYNSRGNNLNPFAIIPQEGKNWLVSSETQDLRDGIQATVDVISLRYKLVTVAADVHTGIQAVIAIRSGATADGTEKLVQLILGHGVSKYMKELGRSDLFQNSAGLITQKASEKILREDCYLCVEQ